MICRERWGIVKRSLNRRCIFFLDLQKWVKIIIEKSVLLKLPPPPILNSIIIFTQFCRYKKKKHLLFKLLFDSSHRSRDIPRKRKFRKGWYHPLKNRVVLRMNYSTCIQSCIIFWIFGLRNISCKRHTSPPWNYVFWVSIFGSSSVELLPALEEEWSPPRGSFGNGSHHALS